MTQGLCLASHRDCIGYMSRLSPLYHPAYLIPTILDTTCHTNIFLGSFLGYITAFRTEVESGLLVYLQLTPKLKDTESSFSTRLRDSLRLIYIACIDTNWLASMIVSRFLFAEQRLEQQIAHHDDDTESDGWDTTSAIQMPIDHFVEDQPGGPDNSNLELDPHDQKFTTLSPIRMSLVEIDGATIDAGRHPFFCHCFAIIRHFDVSYGTQKALVNFLFHRLEKACYDFVRRVFPHIHRLMLLSSYDQIDLVAWSWLIDSHQYEWPEGSVAEHKFGGRKDYKEVAKKLRNAAMHSETINFNLIRDAIGWAAHLKNDTCLNDMEAVFKSLHCYQCKIEGIQDGGWTISEQEQKLFDQVLMLTWTPCLTVHQFLNRTVRIVQKALFEYWNQHKAQDDPNTWTTAEEVELQNWYYVHARVITSLFPGSVRPYLLGDLNDAVKLRNANAHRHQCSSSSIRWYRNRAVHLLNSLGDKKGALDISLSERFFHAAQNASEPAVEFFQSRH